MKLTMSIVVLAFVNISSGRVNENKLLTNCFGDNENGTCEESWIKIFTSFYTCSMVVDLPEPAKRIGHINGQLIVNIKSNFYVLSEDSVLIPYSGRGRVAPWSEFRDRRDNSFYAADGTAYMYRDEDQRELEIVTTGEYGSHQLALDSEEDKLLILAFDASSDGIAKLFSLKTDSFDVADGKINAAKVEGAGDSLTAMAMIGGLDKLLLSVKTPNGGKLIGLVKQNSNPCSVVGIGKDAIVDIVKEVQQKLVKIFEETHNVAEIRMKNDIRTLESPPPGISPRALELDNERLKRELMVANKKLTALNTRLFSFSQRVNPSFSAQYPTTFRSLAEYDISEYERKALKVAEEVEDTLITAIYPELPPTLPYYISPYEKKALKVSDIRSPIIYPESHPATFRPRRPADNEASAFQEKTLEVSRIEEITNTLTTAAYPETLLSITEQIDCVTMNRYLTISRELAESKRLNDEYSTQLDRLSNEVFHLLRDISENGNEK